MELSDHGQYSGVVDIARNGIDEVIRLQTQAKQDEALIRQMLESMCWAARVMAISEDEAPGYFAAITAARARLEGTPCA
jgi:hypothetical protein